jgi:aminoglycoside phosphotransferase (APT) family kinase protein
MRVPNGTIPEGVKLIRGEKNHIAETNSLYRCVGRESTGREFVFFLKVAKTASRSMENEREVLQAIGPHGLPVPKVLWYGTATREFMALEALPGDLLQNVANPTHPAYNRFRVGRALFAYGEALARIHALPLTWRPQKRAALYWFAGEDQLDDLSFREVVLWLQTNPPDPRNHCFVHGDLNPANVLVENGVVTGLLDWEFAGMGWREYDLAWVLRARRNQLQTTQERTAILAGYASVGSYDPEALRWCEVMNYLHVAFWTRESNPAYSEFCLERARIEMYRGFE